MAYALVRTITIDHTKIPNTDQTDFPVYFTTNCDTLNGAIDNSVTAVTVTTGTQIRTGDYIRIDTEIMLVTAGGGTTSLTVTRAQLSSAAASHATLAIVTNCFLASAANGGAVTSASGFDVIFAANPNGSSPYTWEIEKYATTGIAQFWIKIASLSHTVDTVIYVLYGDATVTTFQSTASSVWDSNYKAVYHFSAVSASGTNADSTSNAANGTFNGSAIPIPTASEKLDGGFSTQNTVDACPLPTLGTFGKTSNITIEAWVQTAALGALRRAVAQDGNTNDFVASILMDSSNRLCADLTKAGVAADRATGSTTMSTGVWYHAVLTADASNVRIYVNGALEATTAYSNINTATNNAGLWSLGQYKENGSNFQTWNAFIEEIRISLGIARVADWIATDYNNQNSPYTFYSVSAASQAFLPVSTFDAVTVTESVSLSVTPKVFSVFDSVTVTDVPLFPTVIPAQPNVFDAITVTEAVTLATVYPTLLINVFDVVIALQPDSVALSLVRTVSGNALIIGGVTYLFDEYSPANISKRTSDAWSATFSIIYTAGSSPEPGQEVEFFWASVKRFGGIVQSTSETRIKGPDNRTRIVVSCTGYQSLLNRAVVAKLYTLAISGWPIMIFDIWYRHLQDFGITLAYPQGPLTGFEPHLFHYRTVAECFNVCRDENSGVDYWITDNKALVFAAFGAGGAAPFTLRNGDVNQSSVTVTTSNKKFRNKQWVLPSVPLTSLLEEPPFTTTAGQIVFETQYAQTVAPVVTLDAVEEDVTTLGNWDGSPWYYIPGGIGVFRSPGAPAITGGQTVTVTYPNPFPLAYSAQDDASIAAVGLYESIYQAKNIVDQPTAEAFAAALLEAYGTNGLFPESIRFDYNSCNASTWTGQTAWLLPGMVVDVNRTFPTALGNYVVEEVNSQLENFTVWRHSVTLRLGEGDVSESFERDFLTGTRLWVNDPPIRVTIELDLTGAGNVVGVQPQFYTFMGQGIIASWDAQFGSGFEPDGEDFIIDLLYEGVSIFPSGDANKIVVPDGSTAQAGGFTFTSDNLGYTDAAKLTMNIIQAADTQYGVIHLNLKPNTALPPA